MSTNVNYSKLRTFWFVVLRVVIGWYFLYEGLAKILAPDWSAYGYLIDSKGIFSSFFHSLAANPDLLHVANFVNMYGLAAVGLSLILGLFGRIGHWCAIGFLVLFTLSHPATLSTNYLLPPEGSYMWIDKNIVMLCATIVSMLLNTSEIIGLDRFIFKPKSKTK